MNPKTVLITGAAGGIGRATVKLFAESSWRVIGVDRNPFDDDFPASSLFIQSDISHSEEIAVIFGKAQGLSKTRNTLANNEAMDVFEIKPLPYDRPLLKRII
jgi:NAD(P)-dependent dehydrogenase (short-subunit alcohol dehydrogenase family)